jgi:hypothetical protein
MNLKGLFYSIISIITGPFTTVVYEIDTNLYQSGALIAPDVNRILEKKGIRGILDLEGNIDLMAVTTSLDWYWYWLIEDGPKLPNLRILWETASVVQEKTLKGMKVLVHCQAGINRSSLVNGCVLYLRGYRGVNIVNRIRSRRPGALTNDTFRRYLEQLVRDDEATRYD